jgi:hypothetical protein
MVEQEKESVFICDICLKPMGLWEIDQHKRDAHPEVLKALTTADKVEWRTYIKFVAPALGVGAAFVFYAAFMDNGLVKVALLSFGDATIVALAAFFVYSLKVGSPTDRVMDDVVAKCWICGVSHAKKDMKEHFAIHHPEELRYMTKSTHALTAPFIALSVVMIVAMNLVMLDRMSWNIFGILTWLSAIGSLAVMVGLAVFAALVYPRHERRAKDKWTGRV